MTPFFKHSTVTIEIKRKWTIFGIGTFGLLRSFRSLVSDFATQIIDI